MMLTARKFADMRIDMNRTQLLSALESAISAAGTAKRWAADNGLSEAYVSDVRSGRRNPGPKILNALGILERDVYQRKTEGATP